MLVDADYEALHTPGHRDDHLCLYAADPGVLFAGDLVFAGGSFGRTDLPEGDRRTLVRSIDTVGCNCLPVFRRPFRRNPEMTYNRPYEYVLSTVGEDLSEMHAGHGPSVTTDPYDHLRHALRAART